MAAGTGANKSGTALGSDAHPEAVAAKEQLQQDLGPAMTLSAPAAAVSALSAVIDSDQHDGSGATGRCKVPMLVGMEEEVDLVSIKFQGAQV
jgi:hypothetical protein